MDVLEGANAQAIHATVGADEAPVLEELEEEHDVIQGADDDAPILQLHDAPPPGRWSAPGCCLPRSWTLLTRSWT